MAPTNWSDLPKDIVEMIYGKLMDINDSIHFGAVCSSWRLLVQSQFGKKRLPPQLPLIMYPNSDSLPHHYCVQSIHSDSDQERQEHTLSFPINNCVCLDSSQGWVLVLAFSSSSSDKDKDDQFYLLNPFLSDNNCIQLPPPSQLLHEQERESGEDGEFPFFPLCDLYDTTFISKMVLTDNPLYTSNYTVVLIFSSSDRLAFYRSGSNSWTFTDAKWYDFHDVVYYNDWVYAVTSLGYVYSCDFSHTHPIVRLIHDIAVDVDVDAAEDDMYDRDDIMGQLYIVELSGELVCVRRYIEIKEGHDDKIFKRTVGFRISKLNPNVPPHQWVELHDLGGHMLFLGGNSSFLVLASDYHICKPNHIFFTDDKFSSLKSARIDTGVFNVADASFQWFFSLEKLVHPSFLPLWIQPTMNIKNINKSCSSG